MLHPEVCAILLGNLRTMCEELDELLAAPTQREHGLVRNQLEFVVGKLELAVGYASHGAGMVAADAPPPGPSLGETHAELMRQWYPEGTSKGETPRRRKVPVRKPKAKVA